jgi:Trk K+ transport system NAD-binding subunit
MLSSVQSTRASSGQAVLVCGLGRLGLQCVKALSGYRVPVRAIDLNPPADLADQLACLTAGDFRDPETLRRAGIEQCRSIVLLSGDTGANIEGALAARRANPEIRLVVRGEQQSWHARLSERLGNLVVYEPNLLSASAFAFAVLDAHVLAHFYVDDQLFQVTEHLVRPGEHWVGSPIESAHGPGRQILLHVPAVLGPEQAHRPAEFYGWHPDQKVAAGDRLLFLTRGNPPQSESEPGAAPSLRERARETLRWAARDLRRRRTAGFSRAGSVALTGLGVLGALLMAAVVFFAWSEPKLPVAESLRLALMLLTGGHLADVFINFDKLPRGVLWAEVLLTITGTILTAIVYALLTDRLLTARFNLLARRPRPPARGHVIIAGLGATGERIAALLTQLERPVVGIDSDSVAPHLPAELPIIRGSATSSTILREANLSRAHGLVAATADDLQNVQIALQAAKVNPECRLAVRTYDPRFSENVSILLPEAKILCVSSLAATAYAAAALGEHVISLFQMLKRPVLVVEYQVLPGDTLEQRALWEIAEGYSVVPVLYQARGGSARVPTLDDAVLRLTPGDRLVVLASAASLEAIERGDLRPREYELRLEQLRPYAEPMQVVGTLAQRFGYTLERARDVLEHLPQTVPERLYGLYARRTYRLLLANGVQASLRRCNVQEAHVEAPPALRRPTPTAAPAVLEHMGYQASGSQVREPNIRVSVAASAKRFDPPS